MAQVPFTANKQLCSSLIMRTHPDTGAQSIKQNQPHKSYLPGLPRIDIHSADIGCALIKELLTPDLDQLSPHLWLVAKQDSSHISALTHQLVRGRRIVVTEKPELHLVWYYDRVYVKPLPKYLLSHAFWDFYLVSENSPIPEPDRTNLRKAALGFLRSYAFLVQHRSDFNMAKHEDHRLLPKSIEKFSTFVDFIRSFEHIMDDDVSPRYRYGELRLTRLNFWTKVFLFRITYHKVEGQYGSYFARFYGPILFAFGLVSVLLSAMQVILAAQDMIESSGPSWASFTLASRGFSLFIIFLAVAVGTFLLLALLILLSRELTYALKDKLFRQQHPAPQIA